MGALFRKIFGEKIEENFKTTKDVDDFFRKELGLEIGIENINIPELGVVSRSPFKIKKFDLDWLVNKDLEDVRNKGLI